MTVSPPPVHRNRTFPFNVLGCAAAVGFVVLAGVAVAVIAAVSYANRINSQIAQAEQTIRDRGQPVTLDELDAYYPAVLDYENAALDYERAFGLLARLDAGGDRANDLLQALNDLEAGTDIPPELQSDIEGYIEACAEVLQALDRATNLSESRFPLDFGLGMEIKLPHLAPLRSCARLTVLRGEAALLRGDFGEYVRCHERLAHMIGAVEQEPVTISKLVQCAIHSIAVRALAKDLSRTEFPPEVLQTLSTVYEDEQGPEGAIRAVAGERCMISETIGLLAVGKVNSVPEDLREMSKSASKVALMRHWIRNQQLKILTSFEPMTTTGDVPWQERFERAREANATIENLPDFYFLAKMLLPALPNMMQAFAREPAESRMVRIILAVEQYRADNGTLPETLAPLVPQYLSGVPLDPFDGKPLRYKVTEKGYLVYSVYMNGIDDGGVQWKRGTETANAPVFAEQPIDEVEKRAQAPDFGDWVLEVTR